MANFALIKQNIVIAVIVIDNKVITNNGIEVEQLGIDFIDSLNIKGIYDYDKVRQTSYNSNTRNKYAGIGDTWDETNNVFISPKPFSDWTLNENFKWTAPISYPNDDKHYVWVNSEWKEFGF
tara:strand:+ start:277 stop:642 length:366 start_codon:yes stop_codon:yes gene_type:complete